ncbi:hypothetical protein D910_12312 [Dendroctonus ponderosae]|uniref:Uncharacterized protein n=1 Tax=Dendroctonus ponderosae TaxID=77166 RepID=U4UPK2_DENPD|nr:hypothetical protein D910_12312 [Dendroctonus ponderosae]KAH1018313.1 hypothetical protein HUJ05_006109 [Dendroctonus ponderosae]
MNRLRYIIPRQWYALPILFTGIYLGHLLDVKETERMTLFRDKSALYGRELQPGEAPTWP